jgi:SAM-dependent methyltransferase
MSEWAKSKATEIAFWRDWLTKEQFRRAREARLQAPEFLLDTLLARMGNPPNPSVLDVGSGPISTLYAEAKRDDVKLTCADALGKCYNALLAEAGINEVPPIVSVKGEDLTQVFPLDEFDLVHCANALDQFEDPTEGFQQMFAVCKPGGAVAIVSIENEGERNNHGGMRQWNLRADDGGVWLSSPGTKKVNLFDLVPLSDFELRYIASPTDSFCMFELLGFKQREVVETSTARLRSAFAKFNFIFGSRLKQQRVPPAIQHAPIPWLAQRRLRADQAVVLSARQNRRHWQVHPPQHRSRRRWRLFRFPWPQNDLNR